MKAFHIKQWDRVYETWETRKIRALTYYAKPNKLVGEGIGFTLAQEDNVALLGTWALIEALASTAPQEHRGWLIRNGTALTPARMAALTRVDAGHFERALEFFCRPEVGWLEAAELPGDSPASLLKPEADRTTPGDSPASLLKEMRNGESSGQHPEIGRAISARGKRKDSKRGEEREERRTLSEKIPSLEEVRAWAAANEVDPEFAAVKHMEHTTRGGWVVRGVLINWQTRWLAYWQEEAEAWQTRCKKNARGPAARPAGWKAGDADVWWTDSVADVRSALTGATLGKNKKTAARLREILNLREKSKS